MNGKVTALLAIFVDDVLISAPNPQQVAADITDHFATKTLHPEEHGSALVYTILGYRITWQLGLVTLDKQDYIQQTVAKFCDTLVPLPTPLPCNFQELNPEREPLDLTQADLDRHTHKLRQILGALVYIATTTRPDISFAVQLIARYTLYPHGKVFRAAYHLLQYLNGTAHHRLIYSQDADVTSHSLLCLSDASLGDGPSSKSYLGSVLYFSGGPIHWNCALSTTVCLSSTESEIQALIEASRQLHYVYKIISFVRGIATPKVLATDNRLAIKMLQNEQYTARNKSYTARFDRLKQECLAGEFRLIYVPTEDMAADILTKGTTSTVVTRLTPLLFGQNAMEDIVDLP